MQDSKFDPRSNSLKLFFELLIPTRLISSSTHVLIPNHSISFSTLFSFRFAQPALQHRSNERPKRLYGLWTSRLIEAQVLMEISSLEFYTDRISPIKTLPLNVYYSNDRVYRILKRNNRCRVISLI